jgi:hypothetical protein
LTICKIKEQQTPRDRVLWILGSSSSGEISIIKLRSMTVLKKAGLVSFLRSWRRKIGLLYGTDQ